MSKIQSILNKFLRSIAKILPANNSLRIKLSQMWTVLLRKTTNYVDVTWVDDNYKLKVDYRSMSPDYEKDLVVSLKKIIKPNMTVWDVGANIGLHTILFSRLVGSSGKVIAWEPTPSTVNILKDHITANQCRNVQIVAEAVGEQVGKIQFLEARGMANPENRIFSGKSTTPGQTVEVPIDTLDNYVKKLGHIPDILKIDVEGAELFTLRGASTLLTSVKKPTIILAIHPMFIPEFNYLPADITELLKVYGYSSYSFQGDKVKPEDYNEYVCLPNEVSFESIFNG